MKLAVVLVLCCSLVPFSFSTPSALAASSLTLDTPTEGSNPTDPIVRVSGTFTDLYDINLIINGVKQVDTHISDPLGTESGTWYYDLDTTKYDGPIELVARGLDSTTRYGVTSPFVIFQVDHPTANVPQVQIVSPQDDAHLTDSTLIKVQATGRNPLENIQVRINGGVWNDTTLSGDSYEYIWNSADLGDKTSSIEARATDNQGNTGKSTTVYVQHGQGNHEPVTIVKQDRAMWLWEKSAYNLVLNPGSRAPLEALTSDTSTFNSSAITTIYLGVFPYDNVDMLEDQRVKVREFLAWAHSHNLKIQACIAGGTVPAYFGSYTRYQKYAVRELEKVINFNLSSDSNERFDGVNIDVEPYIMPEFKSQKPAMQTQYLDLLQKMVDRRNLSELNLPLGPAVPRWYDSSDTASNITWHGQTKWLSEHVQDLMDYISIMDYTDSASGIISGAQGEIAYANSINKPNSVIVGVETLDISNSGDPETITFREEGRTYMENTLNTVKQAFANSASYGGIAMHHYDSIRALPSQWGPNAIFWNLPTPDTTPPGPLTRPLTAQTFDYQTIQLNYGRAYDNSDVDGYRIYRGTNPTFQPGPQNVVADARGLNFSDTGLLSGTTYYYKVAAVDISGNVGPYSNVISATTEQTDLKPLSIKSMTVTYNGSKAKVTVRVKDYNTGQEIPVKMYGRFTNLFGKYVSFNSTASSAGTADSESVTVTSGLGGFSPQRILSAGYYWASAYDSTHLATVSWPQ
nr:Ig-like domain-containing protein [Paenibacillus shirakamiensis]